MLRRLRNWFIRVLTGQSEHERLSRLVAMLSASGVSRYKGRDLELELRAPERVVESTGRLPDVGKLSDNEILFGESEADLRRQGLI